VDLLTSVVLDVEAQESSSNYSIKVSIPDVDLICHTHNDTPSDVWSELWQAIDLVSEMLQLLLLIIFQLLFIIY
jgi:hypothetical protein